LHNLTPNSEQNVISNASSSPAIITTNSCPNNFAANKSRNFIQLGGHPGILAPAGPHTLWKKLGSGSHEKEVYTYLKNSNDKMYDIIPKYHSEMYWSNETFIELEDLFTTGFSSSLGIMDIKMGSRTFLESEVLNSKERTDLYEKMIKIDPTAPTPEEHARGSITKLRYMQFREEESSTSELSFRIEAIKFQDKDEPSQLSSLKILKDEDSIANILQQFISSDANIKSQFLERLKYMRSTLEESKFFATHEVIGSSILLIRDADKCGAWMIDFAKTVKTDTELNHRVPWEIGNHEDGYLYGLDNLINIFEQL
jgi:1D-myo-inositol-triphosphate 3-kinase